MEQGIVTFLQVLHPVLKLQDTILMVFSSSIGRSDIIGCSVLSFKRKQLAMRRSDSSPMNELWALTQIKYCNSALKMWNLALSVVDDISSGLLQVNNYLTRAAFNDEADQSLYNLLINVSIWAVSCGEGSSALMPSSKPYKLTASYFHNHFWLFD